MKVIYIAGKFRAVTSWEVEQNVRWAETFALTIWKMGAAVICPHANTRFFQGAAPDEVWLNGDLEILKRCDAVFMVPGWQNSRGATAERQLALDRNIPVFTTPKEVKEWLTAL